MMEYDEDGPAFPPGAAEVVAGVPPASECIVLGIMCHRQPASARTARGHTSALLRLAVDTTEGPLVFYLTRDEAAGLACGLSELLCDG